MRSVFFNVFQSVIVLLYVWDNEANTIVIISCFVGLIIEVWKIHKVVNVSVRNDVRFGWLILFLDYFGCHVGFLSATVVSYSVYTLSVQRIATQNLASLCRLD